MLDLRKKDPELTGKVAQIALDQAHITANKNTVPGETRSPFQTSGIRFGTPAVTSRGMVEEDMEAIAIAIDTVLNAPEDAAAITQARDIAQALCEKYPLPY
jgi:glycine hydroxymethyltransferase